MANDGKQCVFCGRFVESQKEQAIRRNVLKKEIDDVISTAEMVIEGKLYKSNVRFLNKLFIGLGVDEEASKRSLFVQMWDYSASGRMQNKNKNTN